VSLSLCVFRCVFLVVIYKWCGTNKPKHMYVW
jgi:hypothetical protein